MKKNRKTLSLILLALIGVALGYKYFSQSTEKNSIKIYQIGCSLVDENLSILKNFKGHFCAFLKNGDAIVSQFPATVMYLSKTGEIIWSDSKLTSHHKLMISNNEQSFIGISSESKIINNKKIRADVFYVRDFQNKILKHWSTYENLDFFIALNLLQLERCTIRCYWKVDWFPNKAENFDGELTHANSIQEISEKEEVKGSEIWKSGNYLVYLHGPLALALVLDSSMKKILWHLDMIAFRRHNIHDLQIIPDGKLLYFVNSQQNTSQQNSEALEFSSVEIIDIQTLKLLWSYSGEGEKFYSQFRGGVQLLENGNILLTESAPKLLAREITPDKKQVFELVSPLLDSSNKQIGFQEIKQIDAAEFLRNNIQ